MSTLLAEVPSETTPEPTLSRSRAQRLTERIRSGIEGVWAMLLEAYEGQAHVSLGYPTWEAYIKEEFRMSRGESYRLIDQGRVIKALASAGGVARAREAAPFVSGRQAAVLKGDLPAASSEISEAIQQGVEPEEAVRAAVARRSILRPAGALPAPRPAPVRRGAHVDESEILERAEELRDRLKSCMGGMRSTISSAPRRPASDAETLREELRDWLVSISAIVSPEHLESLYMLRAEIYDWLKNLGDDRASIAQLAGVSAAAVDYSVGQLRQVSKDGKRKSRS